MRRFNYNENNDNNGVDNMFEHNDDDHNDDEYDGDGEGNQEGHLTAEEYELMVKQQQHQESLDWALAGMNQSKLDQRLLDQAVHICERRLFWRFRRLDTQLYMITVAYLSLYELIRASKLVEEKTVEAKSQNNTL